MNRFACDILTHCDFGKMNPTITLYIMETGKIDAQAYVYYNCPICERIFGEIRGIMIA